MKKILLLFFIISGNIFAQSSIDLVDGNFYVVNETNVLTLTSKFNVSCTGEFYSDSILLIPNTGTQNVITLLGSDAPSALAKGGGSTIIRPRPPITGKTSASRLNNSSFEASITFFPNPVQDELNIVSDKVMITGYTIYNIYGQSIISEKIEPTSSFNIITSNLKSGNYLLKLENTNEKNSILKFIKK